MPKSQSRSEWSSLQCLGEGELMDPEDVTNGQLDRGK
jgi:hypothetical protein